ADRGQRAESLPRDVPHGAAWLRGGRRIGRAAGDRDRRDVRPGGDPARHPASDDGRIRRGRGAPAHAGAGARADRGGHVVRDGRGSRARARGGLHGLHREADRPGDVRHRGGGDHRRGHGRAGGRMTRVLVVDDKEDNLYYLQALLRGHGYEVEVARHGAEALVLARQTPPDVVVSDLLMPVMDGYTLLRHWKADAQLRGLPFIVYTATYTEAEDERLAYDLGADAFI